MQARRPSRSRARTAAVARPRRPRLAARCAAGSRPAPRKQTLKAERATPENFAPYGEVVSPTADGFVYSPGAGDARLELSQGTPRFYVMSLPANRGLGFDRITYHAKVTQCLACVDSSREWYLAVAPPDEERPSLEKLKVFAATGGTVLKLHSGTWHAGPLYAPPAVAGRPADGAEGGVAFYNLELADTNVVDHTNWHFAREDGLTFEVEPPDEAAA